MYSQHQKTEKGFIFCYVIYFFPVYIGLMAEIIDIVQL